MGMELLKSEDEILTEDDDRQFSVRQTIIKHIYIEKR